MVLRLAPRQLALAVAVIVSTIPLPARSPYGGEIEVVQVRGETVRGPEGWWHVTAVELAVKPAAGNPTRFVDRVRVALQLGFELTARGERRHEFYRAEATAVALEQGRAVFRFYLPPEIVQRDRLSGDARFHAIDLVVDGQALPTRQSHVSASLPTPAALARFRERIAQEAPRNDGVLRTQPFTPFAAAAGGPPAPTLLLSP